MDATRVIRQHPIWQHPAVRAAYASGQVGAIVRAVRQALDLTLTDLHARAGYSVSTLSRLETGRRRLTNRRVLRVLVEALCVPPSLLGLVEERTAPQADTPPRSVPVRRPAATVGAILAPDEEIDPMDRRTLLTGAVGVAGTA